MIESTDLTNVARYFKVSSGYVPNQFTVLIKKIGVTDQTNGNTDSATNPLYLLNLEPWIIEDIEFPQIQFKKSNDIYMSSSSLIKPDYILSVETMGQLRITVREKSDLAIYRQLVRCQQEIFNKDYEISGDNLFGTNYNVVLTCRSQRFDAEARQLANKNNNIFSDNIITFHRCLLTTISNPKFSYSDNKFLKYSITFDVSSMAETYKNITQKITNWSSFNLPKSTIGTVSTKTTTQTNAVAVGTTAAAGTLNKNGTTGSATETTGTQIYSGSGNTGSKFLKSKEVAG